MNKLLFKNYLVTGGCGFIGSHLIRELAARGAHRIIAVDSLEYGSESNLEPISPQVDIVRFRLGTDPQSDLEEVLKETECLFHLGAEKHNQCIDNPIKLIDANIRGTYELFSAAASSGVKKIVFASSLYAYGRMSGVPFFEEESPSPHTIYGMSKLAGENIAKYFSVTHSIPTECLRFLFVYGPKQYASLGYKSVILKNFERLIRGESPIIFGDGNQTLDYIYVSDAVEAAIKSSQTNDEYDVTNVASGSGISINQLTKLMQNIAGTKFNPVYMEPDATHGSSRIGEVSKFQRRFSPGKMIGLEEGLEKTFLWVKKNTNDF